MNIAAIEPWMGLLGTFALPRQTLWESLPPWLEAGLVGLLLGAYIGLFCAIYFRRRIARTAQRFRTRLVGRREQVPENAPPREHLEQRIDGVERQLDQLTGALGPHEADAWRDELHRYRADLDRLREQAR